MRKDSESEDMTTNLHNENRGRKNKDQKNQNRIYKNCGKLQNRNQITTLPY